jgi:hypothetical protein
MITSPTITELSARKQFSPNLGVNPRTEIIEAMYLLLIILQYGISLG